MLRAGVRAGSERVKETGTSGQQFNEGVQINKGLMALGNVIAALSEARARTCPTATPSSRACCRRGRPPAPLMLGLRYVQAMQLLAHQV